MSCDYGLLKDFVEDHGTNPGVVRNRSIPECYAVMSCFNKTRTGVIFFSSLYCWISRSICWRARYLQLSASVDGRIGLGGVFCVDVEIRGIFRLN